jgi:hypothetical protein
MCLGGLAQLPQNEGAPFHEQFDITLPINYIIIRDTKEMQISAKNLSFENL